MYLPNNISFLFFSSSTPTDISNPNYLGMAAFSQQPSATSQLKQIPSPDQPPSLWSYEQQPKETTSIMGQSQSSSTSPSLSPLSPKPSLQPPASRSICSRSQEYLWVFEFCNGACPLSPVILHSHCFIICTESLRCSMFFQSFISRIRKGLVKDTSSDVTYSKKTSVVIPQTFVKGKPKI